MKKQESNLGLFFCIFREEVPLCCEVGDEVVEVTFHESIMGKHGSYDDDDAYLFFEELTNPEGLYHLQPERVRFHPDDYPSDALLYGTRVLGTLSWRFSIIIGAETCLLHEREPEALRR